MKRLKNLCRHGDDSGRIRISISFLLVSLLLTVLVIWAYTSTLVSSTGMSL